MSEIGKQILSTPLHQTAIFFLGQAGFIFRSKSGKLLAVDLYLSDCVARYDGFKRLMPFTIRPDEIAFDYIITTHAHYDHFDPDSVPAFLSNDKTQLFASVNCEREVERLGIKSDKISYVKAGDMACLDDFKVEFVFCDHGESAPDAFGLVIDVDGKLIYIAGDTCLRLDQVDEIVKGRSIDVLIAPINGAFGNTNEQDMVLLCEAVKPKLAIPCHYWCFAEQGGNPMLFAKGMQSSLPEQSYLLMRVGEGIDL